MSAYGLFTVYCMTRYAAIPARHSAFTVTAERLDTRSSVTQQRRRRGQAADEILKDLQRLIIRDRGKMS